MRGVHTCLLRLRTHSLVAADAQFYASFGVAITAPKQTNKASSGIFPASSLQQNIARYRGSCSCFLSFIYLQPLMKVFKLSPPFTPGKRRAALYRFVGSHCVDSFICSFLHSIWPADSFDYMTLAGHKRFWLLFIIH